ncbi:MAG: trigger factor [Endomicrobium sp.]|jgi:trigger factor|nr:trigger factor [Endomicrobium sp.]
MAYGNKTIDFKSEVIDKKLCSITMDVEVSENIAADEINSVFHQIRRQAKVDGFRQGKVPMNIIKEKFALEAKDKGVENIIKKTVLNALEKENFVPIDFPIVEEFNYELGQNLKYRFTAECHPKIDVQNYKNIPLKKEVFKVTDKNLCQSIDILRERNAKLVPSKSNEVNEKSLVSADYDAFDVEGRQIPEVIAKGYMLDLGSDNTLRGFKEALTGAKTGDERDAKIEYTADYPNKSLAGKIITFKVKVLEIKEKELPELNDDFAKDMGTENLEDLKTKIKETLETEEKHRQDVDVEKQIIEYLLDKNKFDVPQCLVASQKKSLIEKMVNYMKNQGLAKEYVENQIKLGQEKFKEEAEKNVRISYILNSIYVNENLEVTDADIEEEKNKIKTSNPDRENSVDKYFTEKKETIMISLKEQKIFGFLLANADTKIEEKDMPLNKD